MASRTRLVHGVHEGVQVTVDRAGHTLRIDALDGDGKGSKISVSLEEVPDGTKLHYLAEMELGPLSFFTKGPARSTFEEAADEDVKALGSA